MRLKKISFAQFGFTNWELGQWKNTGDVQRLLKTSMLSSGRVEKEHPSPPLPLWLVLPHY